MILFALKSNRQTLVCRAELIHPSYVHIFLFSRYLWSQSCNRVYFNSHSFPLFCLAESILSAYSNRQLQVHLRKNNTENESVHTLYLKNSKLPNERHLTSLYMSICTIHVLNCLCKKTATTMSMYINYCQKQKEHSLCFLFFFFLFVVEMI